MRLDHFLVEGRSKSLKLQQFRDELGSGKYSDVLKYYKSLDDPTSGFIYRGNRSSDTLAVVDPKTSTRTSQNTDNYYTLFIDNDPSWSKFPKRSKSLICTTDYSKSILYGNGYVMFPVNGSDIGICPKGDIWGSFKGLESSGGNDGFLALLFESFNDMFTVINKSGEIKECFNEDFSIESLVNSMLSRSKPTKHKTYDDDIGTFKKQLKYLDQHIKKNGPDIYLGYLPLIDKLFNTFYKGDMYKCISDILDPKRSGFKLQKVGKKLPTNGHEVWTDGKCLMMDVHLFGQLHDSGELYDL